MEFKIYQTNPDFRYELKHQLGGLDISINFLKAIGKDMESSGLLEIWVESGLLAIGAVTLALHDKAQ